MTTTTKKKAAYERDPMKEARAAAALRESLKAMLGGEADAEEDAQLVMDSIEGETGLFEMIDGLLDTIVDDGATVEGIDSAIERLKGRKDRVKRRIETSRGLIEQAMSIAEIDVALERPVATLRISKRAPSVVIENEAEIPTRFFKSEPALDKKALGEALKARAAALAALDDITDEAERKAAAAAIPEQIPGAVLSNAAPSLTIRMA